MPSYPTPEKTWQHDVNISLATTGAKLGDHQALMRRFKDALKGFGSGAWAVRGSSDSGVAGMDATDRWGTPTAATGSITTVVAANISDGETFTIKDGVNTVVFEFDTGGGVTPGNVAVDISGATTADDVRDAIITAINGVGAGLKITAASGGAATVSLTHDDTNLGGNPNQAITHTVADPGFAVSGMTGGINNLIWTGGIHSWIVLRQTGLVANCELCIDLGNADSRYGSIVISRSAGFTGGSTTTRPTATDEIALVSNASFWGTPDSGFNSKLNVQMSTDGACTRAWFMLDVSGTYGVKRWIMFDRVKAASASWSNPILWMWTDTSTEGVTEKTLTQTGRGYGYSGSLFPLVLAAEGDRNDAGKGTAFAVVNDISSEWTLRPIVLVNEIEKIGRHGQLYDLWYAKAATAGATLGSNFPVSGARDFMQINHVLVPWGGSGALSGGTTDVAYDGFLAEGVVTAFGNSVISVGAATVNVAGEVLPFASVNAGNKRRVRRIGDEQAFPTVIAGNRRRVRRIGDEQAFPTVIAGNRRRARRAGAVQPSPVSVSVSRRAVFLKARNTVYSQGQDRFLLILPVGD
jgi:hypothetical protein